MRLPRFPFVLRSTHEATVTPLIRQLDDARNVEGNLRRTVTRFKEEADDATRRAEKSEDNYHHVVKMLSERLDYKVPVHPPYISYKIFDDTICVHVLHLQAMSINFMFDPMQCRDPDYRRHLVEMIAAKFAKGYGDHVRDQVLKTLGQN